MENPKSYHRVLTIAGSDSGGGTGIQAGIKAVSAIGCFATTAITAVTAQNTLGVTDIFTLPISNIQAQIEAVLSDIGTDSVKIGMLHNSEVINAVYHALKVHNITNIVHDPVMVTETRNSLLEDGAVKTLKKVMVRAARVITPNLAEAEILLDKHITRLERMPTAIKQISNKYGGVSVYLKAGRFRGDAHYDFFYNAEKDEMLELVSERVYSKNTHGTGCTFSAALAAFIAKGYELSAAARAAKNYVNKAIVGSVGYKLGNGNGPINHFSHLE